MPRRCEKCGKTSYPSRTAARAKLRELDDDRIMAVGGERMPVRAYFEPRCGSWHLTSLPADRKGR